ncbi:MAG: GNAT family N-acetyltransferase [Phycisphaerae bacterium]
MPSQSNAATSAAATEIPVPYRIETQRLIVRCYDPADAPRVKIAIDASLDHLRPWMPWSRDEPKPLEQHIARLRQFRGKFDLGQDYIFGIFSRDERDFLGGTGIHARVGPQAIEIGYWVHVDHARRGIVTESTAALTRVAFECLKLQRVEIRCDPANVASAGVPRKLGFRHDATLRSCILSEPNGPLRDSMVWTMLSTEYPGSPPSRATIQAFDSAARPIELV